MTPRDPLPGQFFMLRRQKAAEPLLARPFSICRVEKGILCFLAKIVGPATRALAQAAPGENVVCTGPLGTPFPEVRKGEGLTILAGGVGIAPFPHVIDRAFAAGVRPAEVALVFGARNRGQLYDLPFYREAGIRILLATDDGSEGFRGNAVGLLREEIARGAIDPGTPVFACGPERMLEAAWHLARDRRLRMILSLETYMGCGVGVCNGCPVPVEPEAFGGWPYAKACREGPNFEAGLLRWGPDVDPP